MDERIDNLIKQYKAGQLTAETLHAAAGEQVNRRAGTYLTSSFERRADLPVTASLRRMSSAVACKLAEQGMREPVSLQRLPNRWWKVHVDAAEVGKVSEYGCAFVTLLLPTESLAEMGFEVVDGPFRDWENTDVSRAILNANPGKFWDAIISNFPLLPVGNRAELFAGYDDAYPSEKLLAALDEGKTISVHSGPFETAEDAHYAIDLRWESPE